MNRLIHALVLVFVSLVGLGCADAIVGAECRDGYSICHGECVALDSDYRHCGACDNDCGFFICDDGTCSTTEVRPDAGLGDAGLPRPDGSLPDGSFPDGSAGRDGSVDGPDARVSPDAGVSGCGLGQVECSGSCVRLSSSRDHCGQCDAACAAGEFCAQGMCEPTCEDPLVACGGDCIEVLSDPRNCGSCSNVCQSGICVGGECADAIPGHLVVIGHDYQTSGEVMQRVATNAVFLAAGAPLRVLTYEGGATATSLRNIRAILTNNEAGRAWEETTGLEPLITRQLADAEVFVVYPQRDAANSVLEKLADQWGNALAQFMLAGGVVVVFETHGGSNDGTYQILPRSLFDASSREAVPNQTLTVPEPGVGVANNLTANYQSAQRTSRFQGLVSAGSVVVQDVDGVPVVFHRIVR